MSDKEHSMSNYEKRKKNLPITNIVQQSRFLSEFEITISRPDHPDHIPAATGTLLVFYPG